MIAESFASGIRLPDLRPLHEWAKDSIRFPGSPISDRFDPGNVPFLIEPLAAWNDPMTWAVSLLAGVQGCKTGLQQVAVARAMSSRPGNVLATLQDDGEAELYNLTKLAPCLRTSPATRAIIAPLRRNEITKERILLPGMFVQTQGAQAKGGMQSKTIHYLLNDEVWLFPLGSMDELLRRTAAVRNRKVLSTSQGGEERERKDGNEESTGCEWWQWWHQGTCEVFEVQCLGCRDYFPLQLRNYDGTFIVRWDDNNSTRDKKSKAWKWSEVRKSVRVECPNCSHRVDDKERDRRGLVQNWKYVAKNDNPSPGHRSFRYSGFALWWRKWADLVELFLRAKDAIKYGGNVEPLKAFIQKEEADFWRLKDAEIPVINTRPPSGYTLATYEPKEGGEIPKCDFEIYVPHKEVAGKTEAGFVIPRRLLTADIQLDRIEYVLRVWAIGRSRLLATGVLPGFAELENLRARYGVMASCCAVDVGNNSRDLSLAAALKYGWSGFRGRAQHTFKKQRGRRMVGVPFQVVSDKVGGQVKNIGEWSNVFFKDILARLVHHPDHELPDDIPDDYLAQMRSEKKNPKTGIWEAKGRNERWDCEAAQVVLAWRFGLLSAPEAH